MTGPRVETRAPENDREWSDYYALRWRILRAPWTQQGPDRDETDDTSIHRMVCDANGQVLAVGRMHRVDDSTAQLRFMAVDDAFQRLGHGARLLQALEEAARDLAFKRMILHAREPAVPFYQRHGYQVVEASYMLFDEIQHYLMQKALQS